ncbi:alcohol dehydrogenase catalytic domain-containing protein [Halobaculum litoreum]|uniref:Alcohol dehydrogenase catalytic domain-containing protein n=1 Tax=Halobaculum litoreum TaxID=3031998 RepID=A0ABD5XWX6_9EURY
MPTESLAAVLEAPIDDDTAFTDGRPVSVEEVQVADPTGEEVLVEIEATSLCHTDVGFARGHFDTPYPLVLGHEGAGVVREVGDQVAELDPGDHVVLGRIACGRCSQCRAGHSNLCSRRVPANESGRLRTGTVPFSRDGDPVHHCLGVSSFTEYTLVTEDVAIPVTDDLPMDRACLLGCGVFTGFGAVENTAGVRIGDSVAIFGVGGVGLNGVQAARICEADPIIAVDMVPEKLDLAREMGATHTIDASDGDPVDAIREIFPEGVDYAFEMTGHSGVITQGLDAVGSKGKSSSSAFRRSGRSRSTSTCTGCCSARRRSVGRCRGRTTSRWRSRSSLTSWPTGRSRSTRS